MEIISLILVNIILMYVAGRYRSMYTHVNNREFHAFRFGICLWRPLLVSVQRYVYFKVKAEFNGFSDCRVQIRSELNLLHLCLLQVRRRPLRRRIRLIRGEGGLN